MKNKYMNLAIKKLLFLLTSGDWNLHISYFSNFLNLFDLSFWRYIFASKKKTLQVCGSVPRSFRHAIADEVQALRFYADIRRHQSLPPLLRQKIRGIFCSLPRTCTLSLLQPHASQVLRFLLQSQVPVACKLWCSTLQSDSSGPSIIDIGFIVFLRFWNFFLGLFLVPCFLRTSFERWRRCSVKFVENPRI